ncbi:MAG: hypothetical protein ACKVOX_08550 [Rhizobacter sp.]
MNTRLVVMMAVSVAALASATPSFAERISVKGHKPDMVQGACMESGGVSFPKTGPDSTYGCMNKDGSGIVCGGKTKQDKQTCDTFIKVPPQLPTRSTAHKAQGATMP